MTFFCDFGKVKNTTLLLVTTCKVSCGKVKFSQESVYSLGGLDNIKWIMDM